MFDALKLLGSVIESRSTPSGPNRLNAALQQTGGGGPLQQVLSQLGGRSGGGLGGGLGGVLGGLMGRGSGGQGGMPGLAPGQGGIGGILGRLAGEARQAMNASSPQQEVARNNPAAIGGLGALAGGLLGGGRGAVGGGLLAVLGSLAYAAMQDQAKAPGAGGGVVPGAGQGFAGQGFAGQGLAGPTGQGVAGPVGVAPGVVAGQDDPASIQRKAVLVLRSMIHAAKADGQIDAREMDRILGRLDASGEDREARDFVLAEMRGPADPDAIARGATSPLEAAEVYAAALMAIEADTPAERDYLARLVAALRLPPQAVARIHGALGMPA